MKYYELNIDGLVGPTHNYAGLAWGNIASHDNANTASNPNLAVKQGISKMRLVHKLGLKQALFPPHARPNLPFLNSLGFSGNDMMAKVFKAEPKLLAACYSSSSMWAANAATITASPDSEDGMLHITPANLHSNLHRMQESRFTQKLLKIYFADERYFKHHEPLPQTHQFSDEGAANYIRFCPSYDKPGVSLMVYGKHGLQPQLDKPLNFPARQSVDASRAIARAHGIKKAIFAEQSAKAINAGVFHNDVIAVGNQSFYFFHQDAYLNQAQVIDELKNTCDFELTLHEVKGSDISLDECVASYLFNSQLVTVDPNTMCLIAPSECRNNTKVKAYLDDIVVSSDNPVSDVHYIDLRQSMRNGGGPACLRLRVPLSERELDGMCQSVQVDDALLDELETWADKHYRQELSVKDLLDPALIDESQRALDELTTILKLGSIYYFQ